MSNDDPHKPGDGPLEHPDPDSDEMIRAKINTETALISWEELQRYYAGGSMLFVDASLNLLDVALALCNDDKSRFEQWLEAELVGAVTDAMALQWFENKSQMWCTVIAPWVLVQEAAPRDPDALH